MLTRRQSDVLQAIRRHQLAHMCSPTYAEIGAAVELSSQATVYKHVRNLQDSGFINRRAYNGRGLELTRKAVDFLEPKGNQCREYHSALQRIGSALGLTAGTSVTEGAPEKRIRDLWTALTAMVMDYSRSSENGARCRICAKVTPHNMNRFEHEDDCIMRKNPNG